jgi:hypothetical protein
MESSGTYGDVLRHQLLEHGVPVYRMSGTRTDDAAEVYDGVPSLHDAKSAAIIAKLHLDGVSTPWGPLYRVACFVVRLASSRELDCGRLSFGRSTRATPRLGRSRKVLAVEFSTHGRRRSEPAEFLEGAARETPRGRPVS